MATSDYFAHRSPASRARTRPALAASLSHGPETPGSPHTPQFGRSISSQYGSPGSFRTEEEHVIYEFGSRYLRAGFAGESAPRCILPFGPEQSTRAGDYSRWLPDFDSTVRVDKTSWSESWELWQLDIRNADLGLIEDKIERAIREVYAKYFLLDIKTRKAVLAVPSCLPSPLLEITIRTLFLGSHQPPSVTLISSPLLATVAGGQRSSLVIDIGWHETTVTAVYEYREVSSKRSNRAGKLLSRETARVLRDRQAAESTTRPSAGENELPFPVIEDIMCRVSWCQSMHESRFSNSTQRPQVDPSTTDTTPHSSSAANLFLQMAEPAEKCFFDPGATPEHTDDHNLPLHVLAWKCLLALPFDVRTVCMSRIIITGGVSEIPGLKSRLLEEIAGLVRSRGWDPVMNYGSASLARQQKLEEQRARVDVRMKPPEISETVQRQEADERDEITEKLARDSMKGRDQMVTGVIRGVESLGAWAGASLVASLRVEGTVEIKREDFLKHGLNALASYI